MGAWDWVGGVGEKLGGAVEFAEENWMYGFSPLTGVAAALAIGRNLAGDAQGGDSDSTTEGQLGAKEDYIQKYGRDAFEVLGAKPFKFNPPLHPDVREGLSPYFKDLQLGDKQMTWPKDRGRNPTKFRLGQIVSEFQAPGGGYKAGDFRYAFRFLYNPTSIDMTSSISDKIPSNSATADQGLRIASGGIGTISMQLLLNRIPDVLGGTDYTPPEVYANGMTEADVADLRSRGTLVDIDYLYRVSNGMWSVTEGAAVPSVKGKATKPVAAKTGDIGMLQPTASWLSIGKAIRYYGYVSSISYQHVMFSPGMVPTLTNLQITFQRTMRAKKKEYRALAAATAVNKLSKGDIFEEGYELDLGGTVNVGVPATPGTDTGTGAVGNAYPDPPGGEAKSRYVWNSLIADGYSPEAAAGVLGNLQQECGFNLKAGGDGGTAHGLCQWRGSRWDNLIAFAKSHSWGIWDWRSQVGYMLKEAPGFVNIKNVTDIARAASLWDAKFEISDQASTGDRIRYAKDFYKKYKNFVGAPDTDTGATTGTVFIVGDSLTVGSKPYIKKKGGKVTVNAATSRTTAQGLSVLTSSAEAQKATTWVVALGTNDDRSSFPGPCKSIISKAGNRKVYWINTKGGNDAGFINDYLDGRSGITVIDFHGRSAGHGDWFAGDHIHMTADGYRWRAQLYDV